MKKRIYYVLALGAFGIITTEFGVIGILPSLAEEFHVSIDTAAWLLSGFALTVAIFGPFANILTSKINRKLVMCIVLALFVMSNILSAFAPNFTVLMIARILPAFLHPVFWAVSMSVAAKQAGPKDAPKAIAIVMSGLSIATVAGVPLTTYAANLFSWHASFFIAGIINLIAFAGLTLMIPSMPVSKETTVQNQLTELKNPLIWARMFTTMIIVAGMFASYGYFAEYLGRVSHMNGTQISIMLLVFGGAGIFGNWLTGVALSKNVVLFSRLFLLSLVTIHIAAYFFGGYFIPMVVIISIWGFIHTGGFLVGNIQVINGMPQNTIDVINGVLPSFYNAGLTLGTLLGGIVIARSGVHEVIWMAIPLLLVAYGLTFVTHTSKRQSTVLADVLPEAQPVRA
ncbi:MAG: MFS transporter [Chitinophagaceae bacterium]|nr:MFS transporter [Chitinophagaceae bacterium]